MKDAINNLTVTRIVGFTHKMYMIFALGRTVKHTYIFYICR